MGRESIWFIIGNGVGKYYLNVYIMNKEHKRLVGPVRKSKKFRKHKKTKRKNKNNVKRKTQRGGVLSSECLEFIDKTHTELGLAFQKRLEERDDANKILEAENTRLQGIVSDCSDIMEKPYILLDPPFPNPERLGMEDINGMVGNTKYSLSEDPTQHREGGMWLDGGRVWLWSIRRRNWNKLSNAAIGRDSRDGINLHNMRTLRFSTQMRRIKTLLVDGADPNFINHDGTTPVQLTALYGTLESLKSLVAAGGKLNKDSLHVPQITEWPPKEFPLLILGAPGGGNWGNVFGGSPPGELSSPLNLQPFTFEEHKEKVAWIEEQLAKEGNL
jgi:hypothetical protein